MAEEVTREDGRRVIIDHPARDKPVVRATKAVVILLMLATAVLVAIITVGGWKLLEGMKPIQIGFIVLFVLLAFYAARWNRGVLPVAAALSMMLLIFAAVSGPQWLARDKAGFASSALSANMLGLLTLLVIPLQILLIAFAMRGFSQEWNVEVERSVDDDYGYAPATGPAAA